MNWLQCFALFVAAVSSIQAKLKEGECEVCIKFLSKFEKTIADEDRKNEELLTEKLKSVCNKATGRENRFCYYVGGTTDAATYILKEITVPLSYYKSPEKICEALKKKDSQICGLQYDKEIDWSKVDLPKLRIKDLKKILSDWGEACDGCIEKDDFIRKIEAVKYKHVEL